MLAVLKDCWKNDGLEGVLSLEELSRSYEHLFNCDPCQDVFFAEVDHQVIGYGRVWWMEESSGGGKRSGRPHRSRDPDGEYRALAHSALDTDLSAHQLAQPPADRQSQATAPVVAGH